MDKNNQKKDDESEKDKNIEGKTKADEKKE